MDESQSRKPKAFFIPYIMVYLFENGDNKLTLEKGSTEKYSRAILISFENNDDYFQYSMNENDLFELIGVLLKIQSNFKNVGQNG
mgnify:CR=1 FL=1